VTDRSDRISLSWQQLAWGIASLISIAASYFSVIGKIDHLENALSAYYTKSEIDAMERQADTIHNGFDRRIERLEQKRR